MDDPRHGKRLRIAQQWLSGRGLEIGALQRVMPVPEWCTVTYVDRLSVAQLREHYPELNDQDLAPVHVLGDAEHLDAFPDGSQDFVIASHLMEHMEYPIRALREMLRVLRNDGRLYLIVPDARWGIDVNRPRTTLEHLLDEHRNGAEQHRIEHYREWVAISERRPDEVEARAVALMEQEYSIHFHVWTADSFLNFLLAARQEADLDFEVLAFQPSEYPGDDDATVILGRGRSEAPRLPAAVPAAAADVTPPDPGPAMPLRPAQWRADGAEARAIASAARARMRRAALAVRRRLSD